MDGKKAILDKLARIMVECNYIQKDAKNAHQKYNYASEKVIKEHVGEALRAANVVFQLSQEIPIIMGNVVIIPCYYTFWDVDSGESISGTFNGAGHTRDDKGVYAATTGAIKYILTSNFLIATGDDPETDENSKPTTKPTPPTTQESGVITVDLKPTFNESATRGYLDGLTLADLYAAINKMEMALLKDGTFRAKQHLDHSRNNHYTCDIASAGKEALMNWGVELKKRKLGVHKEETE